MAQGIFDIFDDDTILSLRDRYQVLALAGQVTFSWSSEGTSEQLSFPIPMQTVLIELRYQFQKRGLEGFANTKYTKSIPRFI